MGGIIVLRDQQTPLTEGTEVTVTPVTGTPGSPAAVLAALDSATRVPAAWVDELDHLVAQGRRVPARDSLFSDSAHIPVND